VEENSNDQTGVKISIYFKLALQVGALVWGAATISSRVNALDASMVKLNNAVDHLSEEHKITQIQNARIEVRLDQLERGFTK
jgi:outer membrane murein-binding lipoprotein Lpp